MVRFFTLAIGVATGILTASGQLAVGQVGMLMGVPDHSISVTPPARWPFHAGAVGLQPSYDNSAGQ